MTRDELRGIINGITDVQLKKILDINSLDIGKAKSGAEETQNALFEANKKLAEMEEVLSSLKNSQCEAEEMRIKVEELQKVIDDKKVQEERQLAETLAESRFETAMGQVKFVNDFTKQGIFGEFKKALENEENQGMSDSEIFEKLTAGSDNLFDKENEVPHFVASTSGFGGDLSRGDIREIMGLPAE